VTNFLEIMGNVITNIQSIMAFSQHEEIKIPEPKTLSDRQVAIIKKSWEIPFAKVRLVVVLRGLVIFVTLQLVAYPADPRITYLGKS
jgi:hypothetical protein